MDLQIHILKKKRAIITGILALKGVSLTWFQGQTHSLQDLNVELIRRRAPHQAKQNHIDSFTRRIS